MVLDEHGLARPRTTLLAPEDRKQTDRADRNCPERAIAIKEQEGKRLPWFGQPIRTPGVNVTWRLSMPRVVPS